MGTYGLVRIALPIVPDGLRERSRRTSARFAVVGIVYGSLACLAQRDLKRLIAYSSVGHMGFVLLGIATLTPTGRQRRALRQHRARADHRPAVLPGRRDQGPARHRATSTRARPAASTTGRRGSAACSRSPRSPPRAARPGRVLGRDARAARRVRPGRRRCRRGYFLVLHGDRRRRHRAHRRVPARSSSAASAQGAGAGRAGRRAARATSTPHELAAWAPLVAAHRRRSACGRARCSALTDPAVRSPRWRWAAGAMTASVQSVDWLAIAPPLVVAARRARACSSPTCSCRPRGAGTCSAGVAVAGLVGALGARCCCSSATATARRSALTGAADVLPACSYVVDDLTLVFQVARARRRARRRCCSRVDTRPGRDRHPRGGVLVPAALLGRRRRRRWPPPATSLTLVVALEVVSLPAFALVGLRRDDRQVQRGGAEVLPRLGRRRPR